MVPEAESFIRDYERKVAELEAVIERRSTMNLSPQEDADLMAKYDALRNYTESQKTSTVVNSESSLLATFLPKECRFRLPSVL
jgi:hypothetical protein